MLCCRQVLSHLRISNFRCKHEKPVVKVELVLVTESELVYTYKVIHTLIIVFLFLLSVFFSIRRNEIEILHLSMSHCIDFFLTSSFYFPRYTSFLFISHSCTVASSYYFGINCYHCYHCCQS